MIYSSDLIKTSIQSVTVATSAGYSVGEWSNHVFIRYGEDDMVGNTNIGRLPVVTIREIQSDYEFQSEPDHFGTRTSGFVIRIYVSTFGNRSNQKFNELQRIKMAILKVLTQNLNLGTTNIQVSQPIITQCSLFQDITISTETSYQNDYLEGH